MSTPNMTLDPEVVATLQKITTATLTTVLLKKGLRNVWIRGTIPIRPNGNRSTNPDIAQPLLQQHRGERCGCDLLQSRNDFGVQGHVRGAHHLSPVSGMGSGLEFCLFSVDNFNAMSCT